jgi:hypothetical protein
VFGRQLKHAVRLGSPLVIPTHEAKTIRSGFRDESAERVQDSFHSLCYPFPSPYKPMPLPQIHVPLYSDTLEFAACLGPLSQLLHLPSVVVGVIRYARLVCWPSSRYNQLRLGCKQRRPSTSNHIVEDRNLILLQTLSPLTVVEKVDFFYIL